MMDMNAVRPDAAKVVYLPGAAKPRAAVSRALSPLSASVGWAGRTLAGRMGSGVRSALWFAANLVRVVICAVLVLIEPLVRIVFCAGAFLLFVATLVVHFLIGHPSFPTWPLLGASVAMMVVYWIYLWIMSLFMRLPMIPYDDRY